MAVRQDDWSSGRRSRGERDDEDRRDMRYAYGGYSGESDDERDHDERYGRSRADYRAWRERPGRYNSGYGYRDRPQDEERGEGGGYEAGYGSNFGRGHYYGSRRGAGDGAYEPDNGYPGRWSDERERQGRYSGMGRSGRDVTRAGGEYRGVGPKGYTRPDERTKELVCEALMDDPDLDASEIDIAVKNGEITLSGTVEDREDRRHAEDLAERCASGKHVQNNLRVGGRKSDASSGGAKSGRNAGAH